MSKERLWLNYVVPLIFILLVSQNTLKNLPVSVMGLISTQRSWCGWNTWAVLEISPCGERDARAGLGTNLLDVQV